MVKNPQSGINYSHLSPGVTVEVTCKDLDRYGQGISFLNGCLLVTPNFLPGERAIVELAKRKGSYWHTRIIKLLSNSSLRQSPLCNIASKCGGCSLQHLVHVDQAILKQNQIKEIFKRIGKIDISIDSLMMSSDRIFGYRNRALIPLFRASSGKLNMGYYMRGTHRIVDLNRCPVLDERIERYLVPLKYDLQNQCWPADSDLTTCSGLRHLGLRLGHRSGQVLITLVSSNHNLPGLSKLARQWLDRWPEVLGVTLNLQPERNNIILGNQTVLLAGKPEIEERICGISLKLSTTTFFQVNTLEAERIILHLINWFSISSTTKKIVDAYCGIGTITLPLAATGFDVVGIEVHNHSIIQAKCNAKRNNLDNVKFVAGDVSVLLSELLETGDYLVVDPPRKGLDKNVIKTILRIRPERIGYLSCDPATLARDLNQLVAPNGPYFVDQLQPVDFFPQTTHIECLALLKIISS
ncbi:MAG: 23S rRNA (uracil(1939)-C(5))-methyltransferase RlmD [Prochlorococcus sp.]